jgi:hypothetical protein
LKKRTKKLLIFLRSLLLLEPKVFCFFFSKKKYFLPLPFAGLYGVRMKLRHRVAATASVCATLAGASAHAAPAPQLLIAPHLAGEMFCPSVADGSQIAGEEQAATVCAAKGENSASRITSFLDSVGPAVSPSGHFALGYTLTLPLLRFYTKTAAGWSLDRQAIATWVRTIHDVNRSVVVYLSANHFTDGGIALSDELARNPANLMWTKDGPLAADKYFVVSLHAWTLSNPDAPITVMRRAAFKAVVDQICQLDAMSRARIRGVSVLGEVHQLYGNFVAGPGYNAGFDVTDYAPLSVAGFRKYLAAKFGAVAALNRMAGSSFISFDTIEPPSKDIKHDRLDNFFQHIDPYAAGIVPVQGWAYDPAGKPVRIAIYLDGKPRGEVTANLNRLDVPQADPTIATPNVGWRYNLDYRAEQPGVHTLEVFLVAPGKRLVRLTRRGLTVVARDQRPSLPLPALDVDADSADHAGAVRSYVDGPAPLTPLFYNPLAELWLQYRNIQVADYIKSFADIADNSCLPQGTVFSHQLLPELNSTWDPDLMAVNASQLPNSDYNQGTTLYGGAVWGQAFFAFEKAEGWPKYAVSEMHPRFTLSLADMETAFEAHRQAGAVFVAPYFMTIVPERIRKTQIGALQELTVSPDNHHLGSDVFYQAIKDVMQRK